MSAPPFMQLYIAEYLGDTQHLTTEQHGAYLLLLMTMWRAGGSLPNDQSKLARIARISSRRWHVVGPEVMEFFEDDGERITQKRLSIELQKCASISEKRSAAGIAGNTAKALKTKKRATANATQKRTHSKISDIRTDANASVERARRAAPKPTATLCGEGWAPSEKTVSALLAEGHTLGAIRDAVTRMRDWSAAGGNKRADWDAALRNWVRRDAAAPRGPGPPPQSPLMAAARANVARIDALVNRKPEDERIIDLDPQHYRRA